MPLETQQIIDYALTQTFTDELGQVLQITKNTPQQLVDKVCEYFDANNIQYTTFSYVDLIPYL